MSEQELREIEASLRSAVTDEGSTGPALNVDEEDDNCYKFVKEDAPRLLAEVRRLQRRDREAKRLREVVKDIANVLGTGTCTVPNCPGCHYEMEEAATLARAALEPTGKRSG